MSDLPKAPPTAPDPPLLTEWRARAASFHEELVERRGDGWQAFWGSKESQRARYQVLMDQLPLHGASVRVRDLSLRTPTLDDVFLELTGAHFDTDAITSPTNAEDRS